VAGTEGLPLQDMTANPATGGVKLLQPTAEAVVDLANILGFEPASAGGIA
jgi:hypothetical protein